MQGISLFHADYLLWDVSGVMTYGEDVGGTFVIIVTQKKNTR